MSEISSACSLDSMIDGRSISNLHRGEDLLELEGTVPLARVGLISISCEMIAKQRSHIP